MGEVKAPTYNTPISQSCLNLDTSINNQIYFIDGESIRNSFKHLRSAWVRNDRIYFVNVDSSIYLSLGFNYGGATDEYKEAEIGYIVGNMHSYIPDEILNSSFNPKYDILEPNFYFTVSEYDNFISQSGIVLGMTQKELLEIVTMKRWDFTKTIKEDTTIYLYYNDYCLYEGKYTFKKDSLVRFSFGFITP